MERLTQRNETGKAYYQHCFRGKRCGGLGSFLKCGACSYNCEICERLAQYEDLGVTPEQLKEIDKMYAARCREVAELEPYARLVKKLNVCDVIRENRILIDELLYAERKMQKYEELKRLLKEVMED